MFQRKGLMMKKQLISYLWLIGSIVWGVNALGNYLQNKQGMAMINLIIMILFLLHAVRGFMEDQ